MKNFKWKYFIKPKLIKLSEQKAKPSTVKENLVWKLFGFVKSILSFTRMSVREINKAKRELEFVLMALNIRKVTVQRAKNNHIKRQFLYFSIEIVFINLSWNFMSQLLL